MELKKYKLADIAKIEISGVDKKTMDGEISVRLCNFVDVYYNWAITKEKAKSFMVASAKQTEIDKCSIGKDMVAITKDSETRDDIGIATYIADDFEDVLLGYHCALITPNPAIVDGKYLNAFMHTRYIQKYFENNASGSGQRYTLSNDTISNIPVLLPSIEEQHTIGKLLVDLERKIELNKQINDNLEAMAKQLYDYWFVQFDFPNEEGKPYKSSGGAMVWNEKLKHQIPEGWEVKQLRDIIETNRGISYNTSSISGGGVPMINLASFNVDGSYKDAGLKSYNGNYTQEKILKPFDLVLCNTQQTAIEFSKDIIGKAFLIPDIFDGDIVSSHHINTIKTEEVLKPYLAYLSNTYHFHKYATGCCSGTNILGLDYNSFSQYKLEIPPKYLLKEFHDFIIDIVKRKSLIIKENKLLTKQRNELLPLLMNGQATINYHLFVMQSRLSSYRRLHPFYVLLYTFCVSV